MQPIQDLRCPRLSTAFPRVYFWPRCHVGVLVDATSTRALDTARHRAHVRSALDDARG